MNISEFFKSLIDSDTDPIVICSTEHEIVYINPSAAERYAKYGSNAAVGKSLLDCHSPDSNEKIKRVVKFFRDNPNRSRIFTFHNSKENKDVYMIALRNEKGELIGYYEKHERRSAEQGKLYDTD